MKVVAALADSASLKELEFRRTIDTTRPQSEAPVIKELIPGPKTSGLKKHSAITHFVLLSDGRTLVARKNGDIAIDEETIGHSKAEIVGLALTPKENIIAFTATGDCLVMNSKKTAQFKLRDGLSTVVANPNASLQFSSAGSETLPDIFELKVNEKTLDVEVESVWNATQPPNDILDLPERNLVSGLAFVEPGLLVSVTSHGRLRVYDVKDESGQPQEMVQVSKDAIKSITADPSHPSTVIICDSRSTISRWSLDPPKLLGHYKGVNGSTRALSVRGSFLATGGLDRYVRVFDIVKRQPAGRVYVGNEIWAISLQRTDDEEEEKEIDTFWSEIGSDPKKRKADNAPTKRNPSKKKSVEKSEDEDSEDEDSEDESSDGSFGGFDD